MAKSAIKSDGRHGHRYVSLGGHRRAPQLYGRVRLAAAVWLRRLTTCIVNQKEHIIVDMRSQRANATAYGATAASDADGVRDVGSDAPTPVVVLFDAECSRCRRIAAWLASRTGDATLTFRPLQDAATLHRVGVGLSTARGALHAVELSADGQAVASGGDAVVLILSRLGGAHSRRWIVHSRAVSVVAWVGYLLLARIHRRKSGCC
ncbi:MAG: DCC1-like thiol-disulfide oxidoreductase family protein [Candidatus Poribacteria bacterium]